MSKFKCINCKEKFKLDDLTEVDDQFYCDDCYNDLFYECDGCGEDVRKNTMLSFRDCFYCCDDCYNDHIHECDYCNTRNFIDNGEIYYYEAYDGNLCGDCYQEVLFYCERCGEDILIDEADTHEYEGEFICGMCYFNLLIGDGYLLKVLKEFVEFERLIPLPKETLYVWIKYLFNGKFICPCSQCGHRCGYSCPRNLRRCVGNRQYQAINESENRDFIRFYLLRHLINIYNKLSLKPLEFKDLY